MKDQITSDAKLTEDERQKFDELRARRDTVRDVLETINRIAEIQRLYPAMNVSADGSPEGRALHAIRTAAFLGLRRIGEALS